MSGGALPHRPHQVRAMAAMLAALMAPMRVRASVEPEPRFVAPAFLGSPEPRILPSGGWHPIPRKRPGNGKRLRRPRPMRAAGRRRRAFLRRSRR